MTDETYNKAILIKDKLNILDIILFEIKENNSLRFATLNLDIPQDVQEEINNSIIKCVSNLKNILTSEFEAI